eukprot:6469197-Amphidinium_carterae.1
MKRVALLSDNIFNIASLKPSTTRLIPNFTKRSLSLAFCTHAMACFLSTCKSFCAFLAAENTSVRASQGGKPQPSLKLRFQTTLSTAQASAACQ